MPIPVPPHYDYASPPTVMIEINEDWFSVLQGIFQFSLEVEFWDGDAEDYIEIEQALLGIMTLGTASEADEMQIKVGGYTGDGSDPQAISGVGFLPVFVIVWMRHDSGSNRGIAFRATGDSDALSVGQAEEAIDYRDNISSLDADGFSVRNAGSAANFYGNKSGRIYTYVAFGE